MKDECLICGVPLKYLENDELLKWTSARSKVLILRRTINVSPRGVRSDEKEDSVSLCA